MNAPAGDWAALDRANRKGKPALVPLGSDERNLTRRVLRVKECAEDRIVLEVQKFGRTNPGRLEFLRTDSPRAAGRITREQFRVRFERILKERFPHAVADSLTAALDLELSFSGLHVRGMTHEGSRGWALPPWKAFLPLELCGWIARETTCSIARSKACDSLFRKEPADSCVTVYSRFRPQLAPKFTKCARRTDGPQGGFGRCGKSRKQADSATGNRIETKCRRRHHRGNSRNASRKSRRD